MNKILILTAALSLIGCADSNNGETILPVNFKLASTTCDLPATYLEVEGQEPFINGNTASFTMVQRVNYRNCAFTVKGTFSTSGNAVTTKFTELVETNGSCIGTELDWEELYNFTIVGNDLTLASASCTNVYQKQ